MHSFADFQSSYEIGIGMLENFNNLSFYFMTTAFGTKDNLNFVIIHGMRRIAFCYKDRLSTIFRNKKIFPLLLRWNVPVII